MRKIGDLMMNLLPPSPTEGDDISINILVHNNGVEATQPFIVSAILGSQEDGMSIGNYFIPLVPPGNSSSISIPWNTSGYSGIQDITVVLDPLAKFAKSNETNNVVTKSINLRTRADLQISSITVTSYDVQQWKTVPVTVAVRNAGQTDAPPSIIALYQGGLTGTLISTASIGVPAGGQVNVPFRWTSSTLGSVIRQQPSQI